MRILAAAALLIGVAAMADEATDRANLAGSWQLQDTAKEAPSLWVLENKGDMVRMSSTEGGQAAPAFECNTMGRECELKDGGKSAKVSLYFSGPKLIEIETRGSDVVKRRFSATGDELVVEVIPIVPPGRTESIRYKRVQTAAASGPAASPRVHPEPQHK